MRVVAAFPDADAFTVERRSEYRDSVERGLDVLVDGSLAARFDPIVEGAPAFSAMKIATNPRTFCRKYLLTDTTDDLLVMVLGARISP